MKLGGLIIGLLFVSIIVIGFSNYYTGISENYGLNYDNTSIGVLNKQTEIRNQIIEMNTTINQLSAPDTSATSFATAFLSSGWQVIKTTFTSFGTTTSMMNSASGIIPGVSNYRVMLLGLIAVAFILVIVGILVGKDLI